MAEYDGGGGLETRQDVEAKDQQGEAKYWHLQLDLAEKDHKDFIDEGRKIIKRYKSERDRAHKLDKKKFNILYSNTEILRAAVFAKMAKPDVRRRFADRDPVGKQLADIIERAAIYTQDMYDAEKEYERAVEDYLLPGRAVVRVCYEAGTETGDDGKEYVAKQDLYEEYVGWEDYRHEPARTWDKVTWEAFRHRMSRDDLKANKFDRAEEIPLNWSPSPANEAVPDAFKRAEVWEIWDKTKRQRIWIVPDWGYTLKKEDDPYGLEDFYPNAEPLQAVTGNDSFIPRAEFEIYRDQADGLDEIEGRIDRLTKALKRRGVYDATFKELARLSRATDNEFLPVKNYADLTQKGGLAAAFQSEDLTTIAEVLQQLHEQRDLRVQTIYDLTGISDIIRGVSDPSETATAQNIKAQIGGSRLKKRQEKVQKWIRDTLRIKSEIIAEHFEPQKLAEMTGFKLLSQQQMQIMQMQAQQTGQEMPLTGLITPDMIKLLRTDRLRSYRIEVETDSTVFEDAAAEKQSRTELISAVSQFVAAWFPILQAQPQMLPLAFELLEFGVRGYKVGRSLEDVLEQTKDQLTQAAKAAEKNPPKPDPKVQAQELKNQAVALKAQSDQQIQQQKGQLAIVEMQQEMARMNAEHQIHLSKLGADLQAQREEMALLRHKFGLEAQASAHKAATQMATAQHAATLAQTRPTTQ